MTTHTPRKRFSQNFLKNGRIIERIVAAIQPKPGDHLVEIGPGLGALTAQLLPLVREMDAIELDRDLIQPLQETCRPLGELHLHASDALHFDYSQLATAPRSLRIVGNLPYQISTPLLFHLIHYFDTIQDLHFMLQKEVVERMAAKTRTKAYGRLSVMIQYHFDVEPLFLVPPHAFFPQPQVFSQIVRLKPKTERLHVTDYGRFEQIVKEAFNYRRKMLGNSLRSLLTAEELLAAGVDPKQRPEELTVKDFVRIS